MTIRVLIVDDSAVMRALITRKLMEADDIEVAGTARNAAEARQLIKALNPDVVTLDIEMPGMDGLSFLAKIMELRPTPVIIVSGSTGPGAEATAKAMQLGAVNCYAKSNADRSIADDDGGLLVSLIREAAQISLPAPRRAGRPAPNPVPARPGGPGGASTTGHSANIERPELIVIGSSTGGVEALHTLLAGFPADCPPTVIVQHVNGCFAEAIARSLDRECAPKIMLADPDRPLNRGEVVIAGGDDHHLVLGPRIASQSRYRCKYQAGQPTAGHRPSVDALFHSAAEHARSQALGILLTGMGRDGAEGLLALSEAGAHTIAQDEASCVVFGMPRAAIDLGAAKSVIGLKQIAPRIFGRQITGGAAAAAAGAVPLSARPAGKVR